MRRRTSIDLENTFQERLKSLDKFRHASAIRGVFELAVTIVPFTVAWIAMAYAVRSGYLWLFALLLVPSAGLVVRLFLIQHDCGHGSFFPSRTSNDWTGRLLGIITLTPYEYWRRSHAIHHASCGNLAARGIGDVDTLTVHEYEHRTPWRRLQYRLYRHPAIMFGLGPAYLFGVQFRVPVGLMKKFQCWVSTMGTNIAILVSAIIVIWFTGAAVFFLAQIPITLIAASIGVWLFYVQHQFERTYWSIPPAWTFHDATLFGSSHFDLPPLLRWFTANVGIHHIHHLASRIPFYRLEGALQAIPALHAVGRIRVREALACSRLTLWDEEYGRLISFKEAERHLGATRTPD